MNVFDWIIIIVIAAAVITAAAVIIRRRKKGGGGCSCGCEACGKTCDKRETKA